MQLLRAYAFLITAAFIALIAVCYFRPSPDSTELGVLWKEGKAATDITDPIYISPQTGFLTPQSVVIKIDKQNGKYNIADLHWEIWINGAEGIFNAQIVDWGYLPSLGKTQWMKTENSPLDSSYELTESEIIDYGFYNLDDILHEIDRYKISRIMQDFEDGPYEILVTILDRQYVFENYSYYLLTNGKVEQISAPEYQEKQLVPSLIVTGRAALSKDYYIYFLHDLVSGEPKKLPGPLFPLFKD